VASIPQGQVVVSSSSFHIHYLKKNKQTGGNMEVTAPVLVTKGVGEAALNLGALALAPFTGGMSAVALGAARGAQALRAAKAAKGAKTAVGTTQAAKTTASKVAVKDPMAMANARHAEQIAEAGESGGRLGQLRSRAVTPTAAEELDAATSNQARMKNIASTTDAAAEAEKNLAELQEQQKTATDTAGAAAVVGVQGTNAAAQQKQAQQKAEMERIEGLAEDARAKASTGTGGKVAVT